MCSCSEWASKSLTKAVQALSGQSPPRNSAIRSKGSAQSCCRGDKTSSHWSWSKSKAGCSCRRGTASAAQWRRRSKSGWASVLACGRSNLRKFGSKNFWYKVMGTQKQLKAAGKTVSPAKALGQKTSASWIFFFPSERSEERRVGKE